MARKERVMDDSTIMAQAATQTGMEVAMLKKSMDFSASMNSALINGSLDKAAEMQATMSRNAGLAAEGIGANLNITV